MSNLVTWWSWFFECSLKTIWPNELKFWIYLLKIIANWFLVKFLRVTHQKFWNKVINAFYSFNTISFSILYYILLRSSGFVHWQSMRSPFDDEIFIRRRNFSVKQAPSAEVIYNYATHTQHSTADSKEKQTQRHYLK